MRIWEIVGFIRTPRSSTRVKTKVHATDRASATELAKAIYDVPAPSRFDLTNVTDRGQSPIKG